jgi:predicted HAD superfamily Cof-like phosphohydrolase
MAKSRMKIQEPIVRNGLDAAKDQVEKFHEAFGHTINVTPTAIPVEVAFNRTKWTAEELVEFLYATANNDKKLFSQLTRQLAESIFVAERKILDSGRVIEDVLVDQVDALADTNYFTQGTYVIAGVDPQPLFDIVQDANMAKLWPDGKPRYYEDGKIKKPDDWVGPEPKLKAEIERQRGNQIVEEPVVEEPVTEPEESPEVEPLEE